MLDFLFLFCSKLRAAGLSHSCPTYSLNSRLPTVPLIPCTRACATVTVHQPTKCPAAAVPATATPNPHPQHSVLHFPLLVTSHIGLFVSELGSLTIKAPALIPPSLPPSSCPILICPPQPFSSFNLLLTTCHGFASSSPPPPRPASPKPPDLRLGLIWTLCHPVSIHHPHSLIHSSLLPPPSLFTKEALV